METGISGVLGQPEHIYGDPISKIKQKNPKRTGDMAQVVEYFPSKHDALGLILSTIYTQTKI
jgi:hypothetical protein